MGESDCVLVLVVLGRSVELDVAVALAVAVEEGDGIATVMLLAVFPSVQVSIPDGVPGRGHDTFRTRAGACWTIVHTALEKDTFSCKLGATGEKVHSRLGGEMVQLTSGRHIPGGVMYRIALFLLSANRMPPRSSTSNPKETLMRAAVAGPPSPVLPKKPGVPATLRMYPLELMARTTKLLLSAMITPPKYGTIARGKASLDRDTMPSLVSTSGTDAKPAPLPPARLEMLPDVAIRSTEKLEPELADAVTRNAPGRLGSDAVIDRALMLVIVLQTMPEELMRRMTPESAIM